MHRALYATFLYIKVLFLSDFMCVLGHSVPYKYITIYINVALFSSSIDLSGKCITLIRAGNNYVVQTLFRKWITSLILHFLILLESVQVC